MFSGMVAFAMLRKFRPTERRIYRAPFNVTIAGTQLPAAGLLGMAVLGYALASMYNTYRGDIGELQTLVSLVAVGIISVLLLYNHRPIIRSAYTYFIRVIDTVESTEIETEDRTVVVAVGSVRIGRLLERAIALARAQSRVTGIPYRQLVVFHMSDQVEREIVYRVEPDTVRPASVPPSAVRIFTQLTELSTEGLKCYIAIVPPSAKGNKDQLASALDTLVAFHERHSFKGHVVMVGTYGVGRADLAQLGERLEGSTLVPVPLFGDDDR
jgi:hypothetical protein